MAIRRLWRVRVVVVMVVVFCKIDVDASFFSWVAYIRAQLHTSLVTVQLNFTFAYRKSLDL